MPETTTPRPDLVEVLIDRHWAISETHARDMLEGLKTAGLSIGPDQILDETQRARVEALRVARTTLSRPTGGLVPAVALPASEIDNLVPLARFILTGSEYEDDVREYAAEQRAAREASDGHVCQPVPDMPAGEDPGPLGGFRYDKGGTLPTVDETAVTRTPAALHAAMRTAMSHREPRSDG